MKRSYQPYFIAGFQGYWDDKICQKSIMNQFIENAIFGAIRTHFRYCCSIWGSCEVTTHNTLDHLQNTAIRIITNSDYDGPVGPLLRQL